MFVKGGDPLANPRDKITKKKLPNTKIRTKKGLEYRLVAHKDAFTTETSLIYHVSTLIPPILGVRRIVAEVRVTDTSSFTIRPTNEAAQKAPIAFSAATCANPFARDDTLGSLICVG